MSQSMDWSALQATAQEAPDFTPVPEGAYQAKVHSAEARKTSNGKDMIAATLSIVGGPYDGRRLFTNFTISPESPAAMKFFFGHMAAFGIGGDFFSMKPSIAAVAAELTRRGVVANVVVAMKVWNNEDRNEVKSITAIGGAPQPTPTPQPTAQPEHIEQAAQQPAVPGASTPF